MRPRSGVTADQIDLRLSMAGAQGHRLARVVRESFDAAIHRPALYGARTFGTTAVTLRPPRLQDAAGWRAARVSEQRRLQNSFGSPSSPQDWAEEHSNLAWAERCLRLRRAAARGRALPGILVPAADDGPVLGEIGVDAIDLRTATGELSAWVSRKIPGGRVVPWATATVVLNAFSGPRPLERMVAPVAIGNAAPSLALVALGFRREAVLTALRPYRGVATDHALYVLHNTSRSRAVLRAMITS